MKVLQVNSVCGFGSTGRIAADLYRVLNRQGHDCVIAYGRGTAPEDLNTLRIGSDFGVTLHGVMTRLTDRHGFYSKTATRKLISQIEKQNPDIIHLHNLHGYYLNIENLFRYLQSAGKPVVWTLHDCWPFTGHCSHFDFVRCEKWKTGCFSCPQKREYPASFFADASKVNYQKKKELFTSVKNMTVVTPSQWMAERVTQSFLQKYPAQVIPNGIDLGIFRPVESNFRTEHGLQGKFVVLGVAGIWSEKKGLGFFTKLAERMGDTVQIVLAGITEKQTKSLPEKILVIPKTADTLELAKLYSMADVFVNPTLEDTFPTTNLEALACGTPVLTFRTGGSPECLNPDCGLIVEQGSITGLETALAALQKNNFSRAACRAQAEKYDATKRFGEYLNLYGRMNQPYWESDKLLGIYQTGC